jgi:hypothetical protein
MNIDFITIALEAHTSHHGDPIFSVCRNKSVCRDKARIAGMAQTSAALVAHHPQADRSRLIIAEELVSPIAGASSTTTT